MAAPAPKFDYKMLIMPLVLFGSRKIDFKNEETVRMFQTIFISGTIYFYIYTRINAKSSSKKIWVPPKPKPQLPFGLGPAPEPLKIEDFEPTTYKELEMKLLKEASSPLVMTTGMTMFMSIKFNIHMSLLMQSIMVPLNAIDTPLFKKYILGSKTEKIYDELFAPPTAEYVKELNDKAAAAVATTTPEQPAQVEGEKKEEKEEDSKPTKKDEKEKARPATSANELD